MIEISLTSDPRLLIVVRAMVGQMCELLDFPEEEQRKVILAVDEACANIIRHTYRCDTGQRIEICCRDSEEAFEIVLRDYGPPLDPERVRPRDLDDIRPGGLGTHFIRTVMDEVQYAHAEGGGNVLRMVKRLHKTSSE